MNGASFKCSWKDDKDSFTVVLYDLIGYLVDKGKLKQWSPKVIYQSQSCVPTIKTTVKCKAFLLSVSWTVILGSRLTEAAFLGCIVVSHLGIWKLLLQISTATNCRTAWSPKNYPMSISPNTLVPHHHPGLLSVSSSCWFFVGRPNSKMICLTCICSIDVKLWKKT